MQSLDTSRFILLHTAISHWKECKNNSIKHWKDSIALDAKANHLILKRALNKWREWSDLQYHNKNTIKYQNTLNSMKITQIKRCIKYWQYCIESIFQLQKQYIKGSAYHSIKQQRQCISNWQNLTQKNKSHKSKLYQFRWEINTKIIQHCFNRWKQQKILQNKSVKVTILLNNYANKLYLIHSFDHWFTQYFNININIETANTFHRARIKKKIFDAFQTNIRHNKQCKDKMNKIVSLRSNPEICNKNELEIAYLLWKHKTQHIRSIKNKINSETKRDVLLLWQRNTMKHERLKYFAKKIKIKQNMLAMQRIFNEWKWDTCVTQQSQTFLLSNYLLFWYGISRKHSINESKYNMLSHWIRTKTLNNLWLNWYLYTIHKMESNEKTQIAVTFYEQNTQSLLFYKWKEFVINHKKQKKLTKKLKNICKKSMKSRVFNHWYLQYCERRYENETNEIAQKYVIHKYMKYWNQNMKLSKHKRFNDYKARLFQTKLYFNKWVIVFEPFRIGFEYERQITLSIQPYIASIRNKNVLFQKFRIWRIAAIKKIQKQKRIRDKLKSEQFRNQKIKHKTVRKWKGFVVQNKEIYSWNEAFLIEIIASILENKCKEIKVNETLNNIELSLKELLEQKLEFKQKCKRLIQLKEAQSNSVETSELTQEIKNYLRHKQVRKGRISLIVRDLNTLSNHFKQQQYSG